MDGNQTIITKPADPRDPNGKPDVKSFAFDYSYWSFDVNDPRYASQETVYQDMGIALLDHAFNGYNTCIFAYGQTGAGKSYSMMGYGEDKGIIPKTCEGLFKRIVEEDDPDVSYTVEISYMEIYCERVKDLLNPNKSDNLKVREHPVLGPYVEDLSKLAVRSFEEIEHLMDEGNKARTIAATNMNATSSRSHGITTLILTQKKKDESTGQIGEKVSRISLVDLAGSERANSTGATGTRLKEGANINKSLTTLGKVISALADESSSKKKKKDAFVLTWLLKDSLGGNSRTAMIAAISPSDYDETLGTLRYAYAAKRITNKAVVNEDPNARMVRELKEELEMLRSKLAVYDPNDELVVKAQQSGGGGGASATASKATAHARRPSQAIGPAQATAIREQLQQSEKIMAELNKGWEEKLKETSRIHEERERMLEDLGIALEKGSVGLHTPKKVPHLVNLNEDPLMSECLVYQLKPGITNVGKPDSEKAEIKLTGDNIMDGHCFFENADAKVMLHPGKGSKTIVNGRLIEEPRRLRSGFRIILGDHHFFRFNHPEEVRKQRTRKEKKEKRKTLQLQEPEKLKQILEEEQAPDSPDSDTNSANSETAADYYAARKEAGLRADTMSMVDDSRSDFSKEEFEIQLKSARDEMQQQLEQQRTEYEDKIQQLAENVADSEEVKKLKEGMEMDLRQVKEAMQLELEEQRHAYELRMMRIAAGEDMSGVPLRVYTARERHLIKWVLSRLHQRKTIHMAETILSHAVLLKEANIISRELGKQVTYQYTIAEGWPFTRPRSFWESAAATVIGETADDQDADLADAIKPCVAVQVIDRKHDSAYTWSLSHLKKRVERMRNLYNYIDRPNYARHFNLEDPFYELPGPQFTFIGSARVHLRNLIAMIAQSHRVPVLCRRTGYVLGYVKVTITPIKQTRVPVRRNSSITIKDAWFKHPGILSIDLIPKKLGVGARLLAEISIEVLEGLSERDYTQVHCQFRLSCFGGISPGTAMDKIYATEPVSGFGDGADEAGSIYFNYSQTITLSVNEQVVYTLRTGALIVEVYGHVQPHILALWEHGEQIIPYSQVQDRTKRRMSIVSNGTSSPISKASSNGSIRNGSRPSTPTSDGRSTPVADRRSDEELVTEERHDVLAWIQVKELTPAGTYEPAPVLIERPMDNGVFALRQGVQRRIRITLTHASGRQLEWSRIAGISMGHVRLVDQRGHMNDPTRTRDHIPLNVIQSTHWVEYKDDGTSVLQIEASWDSSLHDSIFLNRVTGAGQRALLRMAWVVDSSKCSDVLRFSTDMAVRICERQSRSVAGKSIIGIFGGGSSSHGKMLEKISVLYQVVLTPPITRRLAELWRANTASTYVRGEEFLGGWRPRGVQLVKEYHACAETIRKVEDVEDIRQCLALRDLVGRPVNPTQHAIESAPQPIMERVIGLWLKYQTTIEEDMVLNEEPPTFEPEIRLVMENGELRSATPLPNSEPHKPVKMNPEVMLVPKTDTVAKKGYLNFPISHDRWEKRWFVIRRFVLFSTLNMCRPYMFMYSANSETHELGVINLTLVRVDHKRDLEHMLQRNNVFAIYTKNNAYMLQAAAQDDMIDWIKHIDPWYYMLKQP